MSTIVARSQIPSLIAELRRQGRRIVTTNGCFDILHVGHVRYLQEARRHGDVLIVGLNGDDSVRRLKGSGRPINVQADRAEMLAALACVDHVIIFDEDTPQELLGQIRPDVHVKGGDYTRVTLPEAEVVERHGGRIVLIPLVPDRSTSGLIERLRESTPG